MFGNPTKLEDRFSEATKGGLGGHGLQREAVGSMVIDHKVEPPFQHIVTKLS